ncbi:hypothetical protein EVAR_59943_1 [Eumeta japonica]|uniref:Uncharacterized protein n=1 Tax=Eumeta variegata TaxID=151549 RepID=A0A4C1ZF17_EUMVA|nr:hypothetical protein EVAR_59943_1 [Eumeta japonica]
MPGSFAATGRLGRYKSALRRIARINPRGPDGRGSFYMRKCLTRPRGRWRVTPDQISAAGISVREHPQKAGRRKSGVTNRSGYRLCKVHVSLDTTTEGSGAVIALVLTAVGAARYEVDDLLRRSLLTKREVRWMDELLLDARWLKERSGDLLRQPSLA